MLNITKNTHLGSKILDLRKELLALNMSIVPSKHRHSNKDPYIVTLVLLAQDEPSYGFYE